RSAKYQRGSNSEVILNLPGDTVEGHLYTLRTVMDAGISRIRLYPLVLLPGTEAESPADRKKFQIKSRFRIFPRTYGMYEFGGEEFSSAEVSELVIETSSMTFDDYVYCRLFDLSVELFYNDGYFLEIQGLLSFLKISMFEFVKVCHDLMSEYPADLKRIYEGLADSILKYTWETEEEIHDFINDIASIQKYAEIEHENSLATDRAIGVFSCAETLHVIARRALKNLLQMQEINDKELLQYVDEMLMFSLSRKDSLLDTSIVKLEKFNYDFPALHKEKFSIDPLSHKLAKPQQLCFRHKSDIAKEMTRLYRAKKDPIHGMRNILYYSIAANPADYYYRSFQEVSE
ncbi:hypothetical protein H8E50_07615, partial [bacterium]|nr:hypothetical protein [bacterium]